MSSELLYRKIMEDLRRKIEARELNSGDRIPTVNELRQLYGVSHITVLRAYRELQDSGVILQQGKRYIVNNSGSVRPVNHTIGCIGVLVRPLWPYNSKDIFFNEINYGIQDECCINGSAYITPPQMRMLNQNVLFPQRLFTDLERAALDFADRVDGYLLDERFPDSVIAKIQESTGKPCVLINRQTGLSIDMVNPPNQEAVKILCSTAFRYGYRRFIFAVSGYRTSNDLLRQAAFEEFIRDQNISKDDYRIVEDCSQKHWTEADAETAEAFRELHSGGKVAVISASDSYARSVYNNFSKRGFVLHQDYGVAGIGGLGIAYCEKPFLTTIKIDAVEIGRMAVKCLLRRISSASGAPTQIYSPPAFFECGETL